MVGKGESAIKSNNEKKKKTKIFRRSDEMDV